jgi:glycosyltransferase involved in cell wall biosynthesis
MSGIKRQEAVERAAESRPVAKLARKVALLASDDAFLLSRGRPVLDVASEVAREVVVIAQTSGRMSDVEAPGVRVIAFDCPPDWRNLAQEARTAWRLARLLEDENPDVVHLFGLKPVALGCMAAKLVPDRHVVMHVPGLQSLESGSSALGRMHLRVVRSLMGSLARKPGSFLLVDSSEDLAALREAGITSGPRFAVLGGGSIDPDVFPVLPPAQNDMPTAAFAGDLTASNGFDILMRAFDRVWAKGVRIRIECRGGRRTEGRNSIAAEDLARWALHPGVRIQPPIEDARELWRHADICILPARERQGLPRTLLEAAASGRPLIVSDIPGLRDFVRNGVEGLVVPPGDIGGLAEALERLARDPDLRVRMGEAARLRILQGFTEAQVKETLRSVYRSLLEPAARRLG